jgi:hypothetical protein
LYLATKNLAKIRKLWYNITKALKGLSAGNARLRISNGE